MREPDAPGRSCPLHYRYAPSVLRRAPDLRADAIYVVGGLYGNTEALKQIMHLVDDEQGAARLVFNGDFNWFNVDAESFAEINDTVLRHAAIRGNVETEIADDDGTQGCGCGYPEWVSDDVVDWSNRITERLRNTAKQFPQLRKQLAALPMHLVAEVGGVRIAVLHGDAESLAGWSFSHEALATASDTERLARYFSESNTALIASTHTCLPVVKRVPRADGNCLIVNNGSAGMPNLHGTLHGLVTRIGAYPTRHPSSFHTRVRDLYIDLVNVEYEHREWLRLFERNWPNGSPARLSYFKRITEGPAFRGPIAV